MIDIFHLFVLSLLSFYKYFSSFDLFIFPENYCSNVNNQVRYTQNLGFTSVLSVLRMLRSTNSQFGCYCKSITAMVVFSVSSCRICFLIFGRHSNSIPRNRTQTKHSWARCVFFRFVGCLWGRRREKSGHTHCTQCLTMSNVNESVCMLLIIQFQFKFERLLGQIKTFISQRQRG